MDEQQEATWARLKHLRPFMASLGAWKGDFAVCERPRLGGWRSNALFAFTRLTVCCMLGAPGPGFAMTEALYFYDHSLIVRMGAHFALFGACSPAA